MLPRALLIQMFSSIRSRRMLMEPLPYNRLFRWFAEVAKQARRVKVLSSERFTPIGGARLISGRSVMLATGSVNDFIAKRRDYRRRLAQMKSRFI